MYEALSAEASSTFTWLSWLMLQKLYCVVGRTMVIQWHVI